MVLYNQRNTFFKECMNIYSTAVDYTLSYPG